MSKRVITIEVESPCEATYIARAIIRQGSDCVTLQVLDDNGFSYEGVLTDLCEMLAAMVEL